MCRSTRSNVWTQSHRGDGDLATHKGKQAGHVGKASGASRASRAGKARRARRASRASKACKADKAQWASNSRRASKVTSTSSQRNENSKVLKQHTAMDQENHRSRTSMSKIRLHLHEICLKKTTLGAVELHLHDWNQHRSIKKHAARGSLHGAWA